MSLIATDRYRIVVGLGKTGLACARYLAGRGEPFAVVDTRDNPPLLAQLSSELPEVPVHCGPLQASVLCQADELVLSPGVPLSTPAIQEAVAAGIPVIGDIDLFREAVTAPVVAITGSNAKSTVTTLVGEMARAAGLRVGVGGNLGKPALELLAAGEQDLYVLELSSFQLETTHELRAAVATVLNISPDHMDRYPTLQAYHQAKHRIFAGCASAVVNRDDPLSQPLLPTGVKALSFGLSAPDLNAYGIRERDGEVWLARGLEDLLPASALKVQGRHNLANALAALALGELAGLPQAAMLEALRNFTGLLHRCQWVAVKQGVTYYNDSKGTNVGATVAAIEGLGPVAEGRLVLLAGGDGKGASFDALVAPLKRFGRHALLYGKDRERLAAALEGEVPCSFAATLDEATRKAALLAEPGDIVLLSPACASLDMFQNFEQRGECFMATVEALPA